MKIELLKGLSLGKKGDEALTLIITLVGLLVLLIAAGALWLLLSKQGNLLLDRFLNLF